MKLVAALVICFPALVAASAVSEPTLANLLISTGPLPPKAELLTAGDDVAQRLATATLDAKLYLPRRVRATQLLGVAGGPVALVTLRMLLAASSMPPGVVAAAVEAYARMATPEEHGDLLARARTLLAHKDRSVRLATIAAVAAIKTPEATMVLNQRLKAEQDPESRAALTRAVAPPAAPQKRARQRAR